MTGAKRSIGPRPASSLGGDVDRYETEFRTGIGPWQPGYDFLRIYAPHRPRGIPPFVSLATATIRTAWSLEAARGLWRADGYQFSGTGSAFEDDDLAIRRAVSEVVERYSSSLTTGRTLVRATARELGASA